MIETKTYRYIEATGFVLLVVALLRMINDPDIWYHLSIGREIFNTLGIPEHEFLVYPNAGQPGAYHEWGFGLLHFLSYRFAGFWGMSIVNAFIPALAFLFLHKAVQIKPGQVNPWHLIALAVVIWSVQHRLVYRPEMVLYLALAIEIFVMERFLANRKPQRLFVIPLTGFVLSQAHPSVIFMIALLGAYTLQLVWDCRSGEKWPWREVGWMVTMSVATLLAASINPYGFQQVLLPFHFVAAERVTIGIAEFRTVFAAGAYWQYFGLIAVCVIALSAARTKRPMDWLLFGVFAFLAFRYVRNIALLALIMYIPLARGLADAAQRFLEVIQTKGGQFPALFNSASRVAAFTALVIALAAPATPIYWGAGPPPRLFPETAAEAVRDINAPGEIFNFYDIGGYLGWALDGRYKVFIDGRHYSANRALSVYRAVNSVRPGWRRALEKYGVNTIVTPGTNTVDASLIPLVRELADDDAWILAARGERAMLFLRKSATDDLPDQYQLDKRDVWKQVSDEAAYKIDRHPQSAPAYLSLGEAHVNLGERELGLLSYRHYLELVPDDEDVRARLVQLESQP
jgi:hypothetical protein